jgi:hypothetical protein
MGASNPIAFESVASGDSLNRVPDVILRSQFYELAGARSLSSEQRLMLALLADAINVLGKRGGSQNPENRVHFNETWHWIFADRVVSVSFDDVCDSLGLNAECLRRRLAELFAGRAGNLRRLRLKEQGRRRGVITNYSRLG